ncbi:rRNA maturation RNase YbeY [Sulfitobacter sp. LCG007]
MTDIDIAIEDERWERCGLPALAERAARGVFERLGLTGNAAEISILACDDARIAALNADFRGKPQPTNVLSWPAEDLAAEAPGGMPEAPAAGPDGVVELGDIAIAWETCAREAADQGKEFSSHLCHLLVHSILHLLGFDHVRDADAALMEGLEIEILGKMGIDDPYRH